MDTSILYETKSIRFIKIVYLFLLTTTFFSIILLFVLKINDSVSFSQGLVYSSNPQVKMNAPNDVKVLKILVREGQSIQKGDTLFVLENIKTKIDFEVANMDVSAMKNKISSTNKLILSALEQKSAMQQLINIQSNIYATDKKKTQQEIANLNNRIELSSKQSNIIAERYKTDSLLYAKGAISKLELTEQNSKKIDDKKQQSDVNASYQNKHFDYDNLSNNFQKTKNDLRLNIIAIENQIISYQREISGLKAEIENKKYNLSYIQDELGKLNVIAPYSGTISNIFNSKQTQTTVNKGEMLTIIAPKEETFYAKIILSEKDLIYVKKGLDVNLKLDAYNFYQFGAIKGKISYVSPSNIDNSFYCLVNLTGYNKHILLKSGYSLKGEVIIEKMRLFNYILKKMFHEVS